MPPRKSGRRTIGASPDLLSVSRRSACAEAHRALRDELGLEPAEPVIVGVSGGADSTALLLLLCAIRRRRSSPIGPITAVHVHHHLRADADADARFVERLCARLAVGVEIHDIHPKGSKGNLMDRARELRLAALASAADKLHARWVLTAHHADDQAETVFLHLVRGASWRGLAGMPWVRPLSGSIRLGRPLLGLRRADLEDVCRAARVRWRNDPSNENLERSRSLVRHDLLSRVENNWPGAAERLAALAADAQAIRSLIESLAGAVGASPWKRSLLRAMPDIAMAELIRSEAQRLSPRSADGIDRSHLTTALEAVYNPAVVSRRMRWPGSLTLVISRHTVQFESGAST